MTEHDFVLDRIAEYIAGGLPDEERAQFESHLSACPSCAAEFAAAQEMEKNMTQLFAPIAPSADFEDRLISRLRFRSPRLRIAPAIRRAAIAACAAILLGGGGWVINSHIQDGTLPMWSPASNRQQVASMPPQARVALNGSKWEFGGGADQSLDWKDSNSRRQIAQFGDGRTEFQKNRFAGVQRDMTVASAKATRAESPSNEFALRSDSYGIAAEHAAQSHQLFFNTDPAKNLPQQAADGINSTRGPQSVNDSAQLPVDKDSESTATQNKPAQAEPALVQLGTTANYQAGQTAEQIMRQLAGGLPNSPAITPDASKQPIALAKRPDLNGGEILVARDDPNAATAANPASPAAGVAVGKNVLLPQLSGQPSPSDQSPSSTQPPSTQSSPKIIRNGDMEFEVESFDSASMTVHKVVAEEGGVVVTVNSDKLANGKVKGVVTVRVAPDHLDTLVLKLRALGDLKRQNLTAQDVTKQYTDTASELRADRAMEDRLLNIIKTSTGQVKDLLAAEKELATWREKIEKAEGEIRYYDNLVAMSTLSIDLTERDIKNAAAATESENVDMGVEAEDVEAARAEAIKAIDDAKGRIVESELKKLDAGQLAAKVVAEIKPDASGPAIDRLKQLGKVARLEITRQQTPTNGGTPDVTTKLQRGDTHVVLSLYNVANIAPRQTTILNLASDDVEQTYQSILARITKAGGRVVASNLNRQANQQAGGTIQCEVKSADADSAIADMRALGEVIRVNSNENPDTNNVTTTKRGINIELSSLASMLPREVNYRAVACADVAKSRQAMLDSLRSMKSRLVISKLEVANDGKLNGYLDFELRRSDLPAIEKALADAGETYDRKVDTSPAAENVTDAKVQFKVQFADPAALPARQADSLAVEVGDVDAASQRIQNDVASLGGHVLDSSSSKDANAQTAKLLIEVPIAHAGEMLVKARELGTVRSNQQSTNAQAPAGELGRERLELTLASGEALVSADQGIFASIRHGFVISFTGLMWSLQLIVIGLCFVVPWVALIWGGTRLLRKRKVAIATVSE